MNKLWNKILDLLHIEHHEPGTLRIAEMEDGNFYIQEWTFDTSNAKDWGWRWRSLYNEFFTTLEEAQRKYDYYAKERMKANQSKVLKSVHQQQDIEEQS